MDGIVNAETPSTKLFSFFPAVFDLICLWPVFNFLMFWILMATQKEKNVDG